MKKIVLSALVLTSCFSIHASESQSWFGKNKTVGVAAASVATATGLFAALNLWAWNNWKKTEADAQKKVDAPDQLRKHKVKLGKISSSAEKIHERHMKKEDVLTGLEIADLKEIDRAPAELSQFLRAYELYRQPAHGSVSRCNDCDGANSGHAYSQRRAQACPVFFAAYSPLTQAMRQQTAQTETDLAEANKALPVQQARLKRAQDGKRAVTIMGITSASLAAASLGVLYWNKTRA